MRFASMLALAGGCLLTIGCRSRYIETTITNRTTEPILLIEVDYPSASFGTQNLAPGGIFHYRFKVLGSGGTKLLYTDAAHHDHTASGPQLNEGAEGRLGIDLAPSGPDWHLALK